MKTVVDTSELRQALTLTRQEFLATFQFSQGNSFFQRVILEYLKYVHPEWRMTESDAADLMESCLAIASDRSHDAKRHAALSTKAREADPKVTLQDAIDQAKAAFNGEPQHLDYLLPRLLFFATVVDWAYLSRPTGRGYAESGIPHYNPYTDPWRSDLCYFGFLRHTTGLPDFNRMFADIAAIASHWPPSEWNAPASMQDRVNRELPQIVTTFNAHHPTTQVRLDMRPFSH